MVLSILYPNIPCGNHDVKGMNATNGILWFSDDGTECQGLAVNSYESFPWTDNFSLFCISSHAQLMS